jgi:hypothetical protein
VNARSVSSRARACRSSRRASHAAAGSRSSRRRACAKASHSRSTSGSPSASVGDQRPREPATHDAFHPHAVEVAEACARQPLAVEAFVDLGPRVGRHADDGRADLDGALQARDHPRRRPPEHIVGRRLDEGALHPTVGVGDVDEARAGGVGLQRDRAHEGCVLVLGVQEQLLALVEVDAGADQQAGEGAHPRVGAVDAGVDVGHGARRA